MNYCNFCGEALDQFGSCADCDDVAENCEECGNELDSYGDCSYCNEFIPPKGEECEYCEQPATDYVQSTPVCSDCYDDAYPID